MKRAAGGLRARFVLASAVAPVVIASLPALPANAALKSFSELESDWLNPTNWTPSGVPGAGDTARITGGTSDMSLTGSVSIQSIDYQSLQSRRLGNSTTGSNNATLTLLGDSTGTLINVGTPATFTIEGNNIDPTGTGTGRVGLQIANNGQWNTAAGAKLVLKANVLQAGQNYSFSKVGAGDLVIGGSVTASGDVNLSAGRLFIQESTGFIGIGSSMVVQPGASLILDNSKQNSNDRIADSRAIDMHGGTISLLGNPVVSTDEHLGQLKLSGSKGDYYVVNVADNTTMRFASLQRTDGVMEINAGTTGALYVSSPPSSTEWQVGDWAIYNGTNWGKVDNTDGRVSAFTAYQNSPDPSTWTAADNVLVSANVSVTSNTEINSLKVTGGQLITLTGSNFFSTRGILAPANAGAASGITGSGSLTAKTGTQTLKLFVGDTANNFTISAPIADNAGGAVDLVKAGAGTLVLDNACSFTGTAYVANGHLKLGTANGGLERNVVDLNRDGVLDIALASKTIGGLSGSGGVALGSNTLSVGANDSTTTFDGVISDDSSLGLGAGSLSKVGGGTLVLSGNNTYAGGTFVHDGTLLITGKVRNKLVLVSGSFGSGSMVIDPSHAPPAADGQIDDDADVEFHGGTFSLQGTQAPGVIEIAGLMKAKEKANRTKCGSNLRMQFSGLQRDPGATMDFQLDPGAQLTFATPPTLTNGIIGGWATAGDDFAGLTGGNQINHHGSTTSNNPAVWSSADNVRLSQSASVGASGASINSLQIDSDTASATRLTINGDFFVGTGGIIAKGLLAHELTHVVQQGSGSAGAQLRSGTGELFVHVPNAGGSLSIDVPIVDNGAGSLGTNLVKDGDGTLVLSGDNTYTGSTKISRGVLKSFFEKGDKPTQSQFSVERGATLDITHNDWTIGSLDGEGTVSLGSHTLAVGSNGMSTSFGGELLGAGGSIRKVGSGDLTLTAISTFDGSASVEGGNLILDGDGQLASAREIRVKSGGIKLFDGANNRQTKPRRLSTATLITMSGGSFELVPGARTFVQDVGPLRLRGGSSAVRVTVAPGANNGTIRFTGGDFQGRSASSTMDFHADAGGTIQFLSPPALSNGIFGAGITYNGGNWATVAADGSVAQYTNYWGGADPATWDATRNVQLGTQVGVNSNTTANTVKMVQGAVITLTGNNFLSTNGLLASGNSSLVGSGSLRGGSVRGLLYITVQNGATLSATTGTTDANGVATITVKSGGGTFALGGPTPYTGDTYVNDGTLQIAGQANLINSYIHMNDDGITILGSGNRTLGGLDGGGSVQYNGTGTLTIGTTGRDGEFSGSIVNSAGGALELVGGGTLNLEGDSDLHGGELRVTNMRVRVNDLEARLQNIGLLRLGGGGGTGTIEITGDTVAIHAATALGDGNGRIEKRRSTTHVDDFAPLTGTGNLTDSGRAGSSTSYYAPLSHTGTTTIDGSAAALLGPAAAITSTSLITIQNGGSLSVDITGAAANSKINDAAGLTLDGGTLSFTGSSPAGGSGNETMGALVLSPKAAKVSGGTTGNFSAHFSSLGFSGPDCAADFSLSPGNHVFVNPSFVLSNGIIRTGVTYNQADWATVDSNTGEVLPYTAYTTGTPLVWSPKSNVSITSDVTIPSSTDINTLRLAPAAVPRAAQLGAGAALSTSGILAAGHDDSISGAGSLTAKTGGSKNIGIYVSNVDGQLTVAVPITDNSEGPVGLIKAGEGTLVLAAHNIYTGSTIVRRGELKDKFQDGDIPTGSDFTVDAGATLNIDGNQVTLGKLSGGGSVDFGNGGGTLKLEQEQDTEFAILRGRGDFIKSGGGTITLTGDSFFSGHTTIAKGAVVLDGGSLQDSSTDVTLNAGGTLKIKEAQTAKEQLEKNPRNLTRPDLPITYDSGGTLDVDLSSPAADKFHVRQEFGPQQMTKRGEAIIQVDGGTDGGGIVLFDSITREDDASVSFRYTGDSHICTAARHDLTNGILGPHWTVNGSDWATLDAGGEVQPYADYHVNTDPLTWTPADNVSMNIPAVLNGNVVVGTLKSAGSGVRITLTGGSFFTTQGLLAAGSGGGGGGAGGSLVITGPGALRAPAGASSLVLVADTGNSITVESPIVNLGGATCGLLKTGAGVLTLTGINTYSGDTVVNAGTLEIASDQSLGSSASKLVLAGGTAKVIGVWASTNKPLRLAGSGTFDTNGHDVSIGDIDQDGPADFTKTGAGTLTLAAQCSCNHLRVAHGVVKAQVGLGNVPNAVLHVSRPTVDSGAQLDLTNNRMITQEAVGGIITIIGSNYTGVTGMIQSGHNAGPAGTKWAGSGIVTSQTAATTGNLTSLGVATASQVKGIAATATATWSGQTVTGSDTLVMYTYGGDANLDGHLDVDDYGRIDLNISLHTSGWFNGDFNYDGKIDVDDYGIIDANIGIQGAPFSTAGTAAGPGLSGVSAVPEPGALGILAGGLLLTRRRRRSAAATT